MKETRNGGEKGDEEKKRKMKDKIKAKKKDGKGKRGRESELIVEGERNDEENEGFRE